MNTQQQQNRHDTFSVLFCGSGYEPTVCKYRISHQSWDELRSIICDAWGPARFNYECKGMALPVNSQGSFVQFLERSQRGEVDSVVTQNHGQTTYPVLRCMLISQQQQQQQQQYQSEGEAQQQEGGRFGYLNQDGTFGLNVSSNNSHLRQSADENINNLSQQKQQQDSSLSSPLRTFHGSSSGAGVLRPSKPKTEQPPSTITRVTTTASSPPPTNSSFSQTQQSQQNVFTTTKTTNRPQSASNNNSSKTEVNNNYNNNDDQDHDAEFATSSPPNEENLEGTQRGSSSSTGQNRNQTKVSTAATGGIGGPWRREKTESSSSTPSLMTTNQDSVVLAVRTEVPPICTTVRVDQGGLIGNLRMHIRDIARRNAKADLPANFLLSFTRPDCESNIDVEDDGDFNFLKASIKKLGAESIVLFADVSKSDENAHAKVNAERTIAMSSAAAGGSSGFSSPLKRNPFAPVKGRGGSPGSRSDPMQEAAKHLL